MMRSSGRLCSPIHSPTSRCSGMPRSGWNQPWPPLYRLAAVEEMTSSERRDGRGAEPPRRQLEQPDRDQRARERRRRDEIRATASGTRPMITTGTAIAASVASTTRSWRRRHTAKAASEEQHTGQERPVRVRRDERVERRGVEPAQVDADDPEVPTGIVADELDQRARLRELVSRLARVVQDRVACRTVLHRHRAPGLDRDVLGLGRQLPAPGLLVQVPHVGRDQEEQWEQERRGDDGGALPFRRARATQAAPAAERGECEDGQEDRARRTGLRGE